MNSTETVIVLVETGVLLATLLFMYYQYRKTMAVMIDQLSELRREVRISAHTDLFEKLLDLYYKYLEYPDDLKEIFRDQSGMDSSEFRRRNMIFAILDLLYLMYLNKESLDPGLAMTWEVWVAKIFDEPKIKEVYNLVQSEYPQDYVECLEDIHRQRKRAVNPGRET